MNDSLKAVVVQVSGGNAKNHHINLHGTFGLFPDDAIGGNDAEASGRPVVVHFGSETVETDVDGAKAIFRERGAVRRLFESEGVIEGDLLLIQRTGPREFHVRKASKRGFEFYL